MVGRSDARAHNGDAIVPTQYAYAVRVSSQPQKWKNAVLFSARPRQMSPWAQRGKFPTRCQPQCGDQTHDHPLTKRMLCEMS